ncbi:MAG TPA: hypothetical protein PKI76_04550 [Oscillospiraceae bacterium]|nr:hypothetical protein [Oscillospiraceae bacterium]HNW04633.1 hypothetical protein [Oscillospiraceae bacterium]
MVAFPFFGGKAFSCRIGYPVLPNKGCSPMFRQGRKMLPEEVPSSGSGDRFFLFI